MAVKLPRLLDGSGNFIRFLNPVRASVSLKALPLSTASLEFKQGEGLDERAYVEMYTPYGSAGVYRVRAPQDAYGDQSVTAELEHAITEVGDYLVKEKIDEMMAANTAMQRIFKHYGGKRWRLGSVAALGSGKVAVSVEYDRVLDAMLSILKQKPGCMLAFNFSAYPWTVSVVNKDTSVTAEGRLERNVTGARISYDDSELCTRVYYQTFADGKKEGTWTHKDASTLKTFGVVERTVKTDSKMTADEITATVNTYLEEHKSPAVSVQIQGVELSQITGESLDKLTIGKLMRLAIPEYKLTVEKPITGLSWGDVYRSPMDVTVDLADDADTVVKFIHDMDSKGGGGGGGGAKKDQEKEWREYYTEFEKTDEQIRLTATRVDRSDKILEQAGMKLNSKGVLIYATNTSKNVASMIKTQADRISLVVSDGKNPKIKAGEITLAINNDKSVAKIIANRIELSGYVTAKEFAALEGSFKNLTSGSTTANTLKATLMQASTLNFNGSLCTWRRFTLLDEEGRPLTATFLCAQG